MVLRQSWVLTYYSVVLSWLILEEHKAREQSQAWLCDISRSSMKLIHCRTGTEKSLRRTEALVAPTEGTRICMRDAAQTRTPAWGLGGPFQGQLTGESHGAARHVGPFSIPVRPGNMSSSPNTAPSGPPAASAWPLQNTGKRQGSEPGNWMRSHEKLLRGSQIPSQSPE